MTKTKTMDIEQMKTLMTTKGMEVKTLQWSHSPNGSATFVVWNPEIFGEKMPDESFGIIVSELPSTFDDRGYRGRGRTGHWWALALAEEDDKKAVFLSPDEGWDGVAGVSPLCGDRDGSWYIVPCALAESENDSAWGSMADLF